MPQGKSDSQSGHAYCNALLAALRSDPQLISAYQGDDDLGTKVCLVAPNEFRLQRAYQQAKLAGLPCALITDSGHVMPPHFTGAPIITALGIGPATRDQIQHITRKFNTFKGFERENCSCANAKLD